eukprot:symbB.v1.2.025001.t1/scaffold2404.1/size80018/5
MQRPMTLELLRLHQARLLQRWEKSLILMSNLITSRLGRPRKRYQKVLGRWPRLLYKIYLRPVRYRSNWWPMYLHRETWLQLAPFSLSPLHLKCPL